MIEQVRMLTIIVIVAAAALALTPPGYPRDTRGPAYTSHDLARIVDSPPVLPGWSPFEEADPYLFPIPAHAPAFTLREFLGESPSKTQRILADKLRKAGFLIGRHRVWDGEHTPAPRQPAQGVVFAFLFRTVSGAGAGFRALRPGGRVKGSLPAAGLGSESWGLHRSGGGEAALYAWRRSNLVVFAEMVCDSECRFPVVSPARAYAGEIDARAKHTS